MSTPLNPDDGAQRCPLSRGPAALIAGATTRSTGVLVDIVAISVSAAGYSSWLRSSLGWYTGARRGRGTHDPRTSTRRQSLASARQTKEFLWSSISSTKHSRSANATLT